RSRDNAVDVHNIASNNSYLIINHLQGSGTPE
ncbi:hypothetical protein LCGC14_1750800, partial [marine sediment metagenome]